MPEAAEKAAKTANAGRLFEIGICADFKQFGHYLYLGLAK
jgi:hypothetical protein